MASPLRTLKRSLDAPRDPGFSIGDRVGSVLAIGSEGVPPAIVHLTNELGGAIDTPQIVWSGFVPLPVDERGRPLDPKAAHEAAMKTAVEVPKLLTPGPQPGVVGQQQGPPMRNFPTYLVVATARGDGREERRIPSPDPRNSPRSEPNLH